MSSTGANSIASELLYPRPIELPSPRPDILSRRRVDSARRSGRFRNLPLILCSEASPSLEMIPGATRLILLGRAVLVY